MSLKPDFARLVLASQNQHKCREFAALLPDWEIEAAAPFECEETEDTYLGNALLKAGAVQKAQPEAWVLADDSGLEVAALGGRPGVRSARYGTEGQGDICAAEQNALLLAELEKKLEGSINGQTERSARFVCCLVLLGPRNNVAQNHAMNPVFYAVQACLNGQIAHQPIFASMPEQPNAGAFGYDPIFALPLNSPYAGQTLAQIGEERKQQLSHRYLACCKLKNLLQKDFQKTPSKTSYRAGP